MTNRAKIIIGIIIIVIISIIIYGNIKDRKIENNENQTKDKFSNMFDYLNEPSEKENQINNVIENNIVEENAVSEEVTTNENKQNDNANNSIIVGKEEQESNNENTELDDRQKAIDLAKEEWAISVDSYVFEPKSIGNRVYEVTVRNNTDRTAVAKYTVDVTTETVTEE